MLDSAFVTIRPASMGDAAAIGSLMTQLGYPTSAAQMTDRLHRLSDDATYAAFVANVHGNVVGFIGLCQNHFFERDGDYVRIGALVVDESVRGRGVGRRLVEAGEAWARERGVTDVSLVSGRRRKDAHRFYLQIGYEDSHIGFRRKV